MRQVKALLGVAILLSAGASWGAKQTVVVGPATCSAVKKFPRYTTIQQAITLVGPNTTIDICPGTYPEQLIITKNLTLVGVVDTASNSSAPVITIPVAPMTTFPDIDPNRAPVAPQVAVLGGASVTISSITVDGTGASANVADSSDLVGIFYQQSGGQVTLSSVVNEVQTTCIGCQGGQGIFVESDAGHPVVLNANNNTVENFAKNGIVARYAGATLVATSNTVYGMGPTDLVAENGIEFAFGAKGSATSNVIADLVYTGGDSSSAGILLYQGHDSTVTGNVISNTNYGVSVVGTGAGDADNNSIKSNTISQTVGLDGIDICGSNHDSVSANDIRGSGQSAIHVEGSGGACATSLYASIGTNTINAACAGLLFGSDVDSNAAITAPSKFYNALTNVSISSTDSCPVGQAQVRHGAKVSSHGKVQP